MKERHVSRARCRRRGARDCYRTKGKGVEEGREGQETGGKCHQDRHGTRETQTQIELKESSVAGEASEFLSRKKEIQNVTSVYLSVRTWVDPHHLSSAGILTGKREEAQRKEKKFNSVKDEHDELQRTLTKSEELLQTLLTGVTSSSSETRRGIPRSNS